MNQVMIVAAEASSVTYAQRLLEYWQSENKKIKAFGVGSKDMEKLGFERIGKAEEMAVVGAAEIISAYSRLKKVFDDLVAAAAERRPNVVIVMDYPEFNLMLSKKLHALGIPVVYYISPQVWAWRKGRVKTIQKYCQKVFVLFPFEVAFYKEHDVPCQFVGHPILDELDEKLFDPVYRKNHRNQCGIRDDEIVVGLMPGSRNLELKQHFAIQLEVAKKLALKHQNVKVLIMVAPTFEKEKLEPYLEDFRLEYIVMKDDPARMVHLADFVLVASGTATLMVGLLQKPMVIMYRMKFMTGLFAKIMIRGVKYFGLVNLILGREVCPERWQSGANTETLFTLMDRYFTDPAYTAKVREDLAGLRQHLGDKGATKRVAESLEEYFKS
ncbi:MAG: lipid-A-disaccharide synthase [Bdellovibrionaceae bacterium]|nr:lipid-A-disaccharide synthase [Pseudobdellovibrionaceae bacterium]